MQISREMFDEQHRPRFGKTNPERMELAFWEWMIRGDANPPDDDSLLGRYGLMMREGVLKSGYGPYRARDLFQAPSNKVEGPIWTFDRMGQTCTKLPDGRIVYIGGEHEDFYDPDFCIYNDVVVFTPENRIEIYGYPRELFPPIDSHSASLVNGQIFLIGCLGYKDERRVGFTPVYSLDTNDYRITSLKTSGPAPGWIFNHESTVESDGTITLKKGKLIVEMEGQQRTRRNFDEYSYNPVTGVWSRLTNLQARQLSIHSIGNEFFPSRFQLDQEYMFPNEIAGAELLGISEENSSEGWYRINGCGVSISINLRNIELVFFGNLPEIVVTRFAEAIRERAESIIQQPFVFEQI